MDNHVGVDKREPDCMAYGLELKADATTHTQRIIHIMVDVESMFVMSGTKVLNVLKNGRWRMDIPMH